jgi:hypothetical protein
MKNLPDLDLENWLQTRNEDLRELKAHELIEMFSNYDDTMMQELAYAAFLAQGPWGIHFNIERGVQRILMDLNLPLFEGKGVSWKLTQLSPVSIWASQDTLERERILMVRAAINYMNNAGKPIPPVAIWYNRLENRYRYVAHDGHHRIYVCWEMGIPVPVVLLEYWLDNPEESIIAKKMMFDELDMLVINMPISEFCTI